MSIAELTDTKLNQANGRNQKMSHFHAKCGRTFFARPMTQYTVAAPPASQRRYSAWIQGVRNCGELKRIVPLPQCGTNFSSQPPELNKNVWNHRDLCGKPGLAPCLSQSGPGVIQMAVLHGVRNEVKPSRHRSSRRPFFGTSDLDDRQRLRHLARVPIHLTARRTALHTRAGPYFRKW
jgi:hypothetical protein